MTDELDITDNDTDVDRKRWRVMIIPLDDDTRVSVTPYQLRINHKSLGIYCNSWGFFFKELLALKINHNVNELQTQDIKDLQDAFNAAVADVSAMADRLANILPFPAVLKKLRYDPPPPKKKEKATEEDDDEC